MWEQWKRPWSTLLRNSESQTVFLRFTFVTSSAVIRKLGQLHSVVPTLMFLNTCLSHSFLRNPRSQRLCFLLWISLVCINSANSFISTCSVLMTSEMHNSYKQFYSTVFCLLYMFRTNLVVHHQEHGIIYCITQFGTIGTIVQASLDSPARLDKHLFVKFVPTSVFMLIRSAFLNLVQKQRRKDSAVLMWGP